MRVAHKVTDHHLHHERQWQAAVTTHWVHQLPTVGVDKHIIIFPNTWANHYTQSASWVSAAFPEAMGRLRRYKACNEDVKERRDRGTHRNHLAEIAILRRGIGELDSTPARVVVGDEAEQSLLPRRLLLSASVHSCHNRATASPPDLAAYRRSWGWTTKGLHHGARLTANGRGQHGTRRDLACHWSLLSSLLLFLFQSPSSASFLKILLTFFSTLSLPLRSISLTSISSFLSNPYTQNRAAS